MNRIDCDNLEQLTDCELVELMAQGEQDALGELYDRYSHGMFLTARRWLKNGEAAEDLVQDVFMEAWRCAGSYNNQKISVRSWLLMRLKSRAMDRYRSDERKARLNPQYHLSWLLQQSVDGGLDYELLHAHIQSLSDVQKEVLDAIYFRGEHTSEAAERLEVPTGTVKSRLASALKKLRESVGVDLTPKS